MKYVNNLNEASRLFLLQKRVERDELMLRRESSENDAMRCDEIYKKGDVYHQLVCSVVKAAISGFIEREESPGQ